MTTDVPRTYNPQAGGVPPHSTASMDTHGGDEKQSNPHADYAENATKSAVAKAIRVGVVSGCGKVADALYGANHGILRYDAKLFDRDTDDLSFADALTLVDMLRTRLATIDSQAEVLLVARADLMKRADDMVQTAMRYQIETETDRSELEDWLANDVAPLIDRLASYMKGQDDRLVAMGDRAARAEAASQELNAEADQLNADLESSGRFRRLVERIAAWTYDELAAVDARQTRYVARLVRDGADPTDYPPFADPTGGYAQFDITKPMGLRNDALLAIDVLENYANRGAPLTPGDALRIVRTVRRVLHDRDGMKAQRDDAVVERSEVKDAMVDQTKRHELAVRDLNTSRQAWRAAVSEANADYEREREKALAAIANAEAATVRTTRTEKLLDAVIAFAKRPPANVEAILQRDERTRDGSEAAEVALWAQEVQGNAIRFIAELATMTDIEADALDGYEVRTIAGLLQVPDDDYNRAPTVPRLYGDEDRKRAADKLDGTLSYRLETVDLVAETLGMRRAGA